MSAVHMSALGSEDWELTDEPGPKPGCLIVQLRRRAHVMPWFRFAYAEGDNGRIVAVFASHIVTVSGHGLAVLLAPSRRSGWSDSFNPPRMRRNSAFVGQVPPATTDRVSPKFQSSRSSRTGVPTVSNKCREIAFKQAWTEGRRKVNRAWTKG